MELDNVFSFLKEGHKKWWFDHQSPKVCKIGSNGVGHDLIHPVDQLQTAYRNAFSMYKAVAGLQDEYDTKVLELDEIQKSPRGGIAERKLKRELEMTKMVLDERKEALQVYVDHIKEIQETVAKLPYGSFDDALADIWKARLLYRVKEKSHPFGHDFKVALMTEAEKRQFAEQAGLPSNVQLPDGTNVDVLPDGDAVLRELEGFKQKELAHGQNLLVSVREREPS